MNYSQIEKEGLSIIFGLKKFHHYLFGRHFLLKTDHKPLVNIFGPEKGIPNHTVSRLNRWALLLAEYTFDIEHVGTNDMAADFLSRAPKDAPETEPSAVDRSINTIPEASVNQLPVIYEQVERATGDDHT